jgi:hypothetical protein
MSKKTCSGFECGCFKSTNWLADSHERVVGQGYAVWKEGRVV